MNKMVTNVLLLAKLNYKITKGRNSSDKFGRYSWKHGLRTPRASFFSKILNSCTWADILGWNFLRHLGNFRPDYQHPFWYCDVSPCPCFPLFNHYFYRRTPKYLFGSGILIWAANYLRFNLRVSVVHSWRIRVSICKKEFLNVITTETNRDLYLLKKDSK